MTGSLDKEVIRGVLKSHVGEVKDCYENELASDTVLAGKVMVRFTIAGTGEVIASTAESSTMNNPRVEGCIVQAVRRWQFAA